MFAIYRNKKLLEPARTLRRNMTPQERHLWYDFLRNYPIKVYKQRIIGNFIVDFYCASVKLAIEVDGSQHYTEGGEAHDIERTWMLQRLGIDVIRYSNREVDQQFDSVCVDIDGQIKRRCLPNQ